MSVNHHPDDATLLSYAAASLSESFETLISCHLMQCEQCRKRIADAELLGAALVESQEPKLPDSSRDRFMAMLDDEPDSFSAIEQREPSIDQRPLNVPAEVQQVLDGKEDSLNWKRLVPGIQQIKLGHPESGLRLLKISPGISIPLHSHHGSELTLILQGSYTDELGRFQKGDVADLDPEVDHQPITDGSEACICLIATDAPLKFQGIIPKLLQPFTGL